MVQLSRYFEDWWRRGTVAFFAMLHKILSLMYTSFSFVDSVMIFPLAHEQSSIIHESNAGCIAPLISYRNFNYHVCNILVSDRWYSFIHSFLELSSLYRSLCPSTPGFCGPQPSTPIPRFTNVMRSMKTVRKVKIRKSKMKFPLISM
jgi:hypothetical protein